MTGEDDRENDQIAPTGSLRKYWESASARKLRSKSRLGADHDTEESVMSARSRRSARKVEQEAKLDSESTF